MRWTFHFADASDLMEMAVEEEDDEAISAVARDLEISEKRVSGLEFQRMFSGRDDANNAFWTFRRVPVAPKPGLAEMLLRMYLRWGEQHGFKTTLMEVSPGDVAGIKSRDHQIRW